MKRKNKKFQKETSSLIKLSLFQKNDGKFSKKCPSLLKMHQLLIIKNINLLKNMFQIMESHLSKITSVSYNKQKKLTREIKKQKS